MTKSETLALTTLPDSAKFCHNGGCGGNLVALRQIDHNLYGVFEYAADGFTPSDRRHVCRPVQAWPGGSKWVEINPTV